MPTFTLLFLAAFGLSLVTRIGLALRHIGHVRARRLEVPADFAAQITLDAHQKAADYTIAKTRLSLLHILLESAMLLAFTLGGGLEALGRAAAALPAGTLWQGTALILGVFAIIAVAELPLELYHRAVGAHRTRRYPFRPRQLGPYPARQGANG